MQARICGEHVEHRVGSYVKPSAIIKATNPVDRILDSSNSRLYRRRKIFTNPKTATGDKKETNIVIAAYGTQITLHNAMSGTNYKLARSIPSKSLQDEKTPLLITVPTGNQEDDVTASDFIDVKIITKSAPSDGKGRPGKAELIPKDSSTPSPSACSSESIDRSFKIIPSLPPTENNDQFKKKFVWRRTAWDKIPDSMAESSPSITSFVDIKEIRNSIGDATCLLEQQQIETQNHQHHESSGLAGVANGQRPSTVVRPIVRNEDPQEQDNSFESILRYYLAPRLNETGLHHQPSNDRIKEIWGARSKIDISSRIQFTHEKLLRPKSASLPLSDRHNQEKISSINDENVPDRIRSQSTTTTRPQSKKTKRRRPRSVTYKSNMAKPNHTTANDAIVGFGVKSLIRQNHRPTTSIIYSKPDVNAMPSITPCVRKARVSHKTFAYVHQPTTDSASERTHSWRMSEHSKGNHSLNSAVKVSKLSQPSLHNKGDDVPTKTMQDETTESEATSSNNHNRLFKPQESQHQKQQHDCIEEDKGEADEKPLDGSTLGQNDIQPECPAGTTNDEKCPEKGDHNHVPQALTGLEQIHSRGVKIRPLFTQHLAKFNGPTTTDVNEASKKNRMIKQWLKTLNSPQDSKS